MTKKHAPAYLPYRLRFDAGPDEVAILISLDFWHDASALILPTKRDDCKYKLLKGTHTNVARYTEYASIWDMKPILKPYAEAQDDPALTSYEQGLCHLPPAELPHHLFDKLCSLHYDVFGLIEAGEATVYDHQKHNKDYFVGLLDIWGAQEHIAHALSHYWQGNITKEDAIQIAFLYHGHGLEQERQAIAEIVNREEKAYAKVYAVANEIEKAARKAYEAANHLNTQQP